MKKTILSEIEKSTQVDKALNSLVPIVVGVSAHRNIRIALKDKVKNEVKNLLSSLRETCPSSPIMLLNGLASGGDQWCAEALKEFAIENGERLGEDVRLAIVLPTAEDEYLNLNDFTQTELDNYNELKEAFSAQAFLSLDIENLTEERKKELALSPRDYAFRQQAIFVATKSHILLALWNGEEVTSKSVHTACGTGGAVEFALNHSYHRSSGSEFDFNYDSVVAVVTSPRENNPLAENKKVESYFLTSTNNSLNSQVSRSPQNEEESAEKARYDRHEILPEFFVKTLLRTDRFNADVKEFAKKISEGKETFNDYPLITNDEYECAEAQAKRLHDCHHVSSKLSVKYKNRWLSYIKLLSFLGGLLLIAFMAYENLPWKRSATIVSLSLFAIIAFAYLYTRHGKKVRAQTKKLGYSFPPFDAHDCFVEYRALSEALRVQYYLCENGINYDIGSSFTWSQKTGVAGVKKATTVMLLGESVCCWETDAYKQKVAESSSTNSLVSYSSSDAQAVLEDRLSVAWIGRFTKNEKSGGWDLNKNGQVGYHLKKFSYNRKEIAKNEKISSACMLLTLIAYLALFIGTLILKNGWDGIALNGSEHFSVGTIIKLTLSSIAVLTFFLSYY